MAESRTGKQNFFEELEQIEKEDFIKVKKEKELSIRDKPKGYDTNAVVVISLMAFTVFIVVTVMYAVYAIIHVSGVSGLAGVHLTPALKKAASEMVDDVTGKSGNIVPGYKGWAKYKNNQLEFMYPQDWEMKDEGNVVLKKYHEKQFDGRFDSLDMSMTFGEMDNPDNLPVGQILEKNNRSISKDLITEKIAGQDAFRTNETVLDTGLISEGIYWVMDKKIVYLENIYFDKQHKDMLEADCLKVINSLKFF